MSHPPRDFAPATMIDLLAALPAGARVLDLGCGKGSFRYGDFPHLAIEAVDKLPRPASGDFPAHVRYQQAHAERLPYPDSTFELIICNFILEHVTGFTAAIGEIARVLTTGGHFYMAVPNAHSFEDLLYRGLYAGGDHLQRHTFESVLATVYGQTSLKLISYIEWPASFTFFEDYEGLRAFTTRVVEACHDALGVDLRARSNYLFVFQALHGIGRRVFTTGCGYCGNATADPVAVGQPWTCPACGRLNGAYTDEALTVERLEADMQALWQRYPSVRPKTARNLAYRLKQSLRSLPTARERMAVPRAPAPAARASQNDVPRRVRLALRMLRRGHL
jgi:SAM-dependent methyltransferase